MPDKLPDDDKEDIEVNFLITFVKQGRQQCEAQKSVGLTINNCCKL